MLVFFFPVVGKFTISTKISAHELWGEPTKFWWTNSGWLSPCQLHASGWIYFCIENKPSDSRNTTNSETGRIAHSRFSSLLRTSQKISAFSRDTLLCTGRTLGWASEISGIAFSNQLNFVLPSCGIAKHYSKLGGSKYSSSHFTIKGTENNRESFWPKAHMSQQPQCCPPKPHLLNYASRC